MKYVKQCTKTNLSKNDVTLNLMLDYFISRFGNKSKYTQFISGKSYYLKHIFIMKKQLNNIIQNINNDIWFIKPVNNFGGKDIEIVYG